MRSYDIIVVGAGLAGASFAAALGGSRYSIALVESRAPQRPPGWDARIYSVNPAGVGFLSDLGIWGRLDPQRICPIHEMEIYGDRGGRLNFSAYEACVDVLAQVVEASAMQCELWETVKRLPNVELLCPAQPEALELTADKAVLSLSDGRMLEGRLIVGADGAQSWLRAAAGLEAELKPYGDSGVVANFRTAKAHRNTAFQWFREDGVLAYLPLPEQQISIVWSTPEAHAAELCALEPQELCGRVADAGAWRLGELSPVTPAVAFPLRLMQVPQIVAPRVALIGDAAHAIHPLSGHGINLGFADARSLSGILRAAPGHIDCGDHGLLRRHARARAEETALIRATTHGLQQLFHVPSGPIAHLRNLGLNLTHRLPVVRNVLVRYALG